MEIKTEIENIKEMLAGYTGTAHAQAYAAIEFLENELETLRAENAKLIAEREVNKLKAEYYDTYKAVCESKGFNSLDQLIGEYSADKRQLEFLKAEREQWMKQETVKTLEVKPKEGGWYWVTVYFYKTHEYMQGAVYFSDLNNAWDYMNHTDNCYCCFIHNKGQAKTEMAHPLPAQQVPDKLDKPARVNATVFGVGVSTRLVIEAAQRFYEWRLENPPEGDDAFKKKVFNFIDGLSAAPKPEDK